MDKFEAPQIIRSMDIDEDTFKACFSNLMLLYRQYIKPINPANNEWSFIEWSFSNLFQFDLTTFNWKIHHNLIIVFNSN